MDKTIPTEEQIDHIIRTLFTMVARKYGVEIEITRKRDKKNEKNN